MDSGVSSARETCLKLPEIISLILESMRLPTALGIPPQEERINFRNVALTCKYLADPALNELWRVQTSLYPLLLTLPERLYEKGIVTVNDGQYRVPNFREGEVVEFEDWERVSHYAPKIKILLSADRDYASETLWNVLTAFRPAALPSLLPNLNQFHLRSMMMHHARILLSPSITEFHMKFIASATAVSARASRATFFAMLPDLCPSITTLSLDILPSDVALTERITKALGKLKTLQTLQCDRVTRSVLGNISRMEQLYKLSIKDIEPGPLILERESCLPSIKELVYQGSDAGIASFCQLLQFISSSVLRSITIDSSGGEGGWTEWGTLLRSISHFQPSLRSLTICGGANAGSAPTSQIVEADLVAPLATLDGLVELRLDHIQFQSFPITAEQLHRLALLWPTLLHLTINLKVGFEGLVSVVETCPRLCSLTFSLQPETIPDNFEEKLKSIKSNRFIRSFGIGQNSQSRMPKDAVAVALFLVTLFPNLTSIHRGKGDPTNQDAWSEVGRSIPTIQQARRFWQEQDKRTAQGAIVK